MVVHHVTPILNVSDIEASIEWLRTFGWTARFTWNGAFDAAPPATFAAIGSAGAQIFLCRDGQGSRGVMRPRFPDDDNGTDGVWMSWWLETPADVDAAHALAVEHGLDVTWPPTDEPWGVREFHLRHPDGHTFRIGSGLPGTG